MKTIGRLSNPQPLERFHSSYPVKKNSSNEEEAQSMEDLPTSAIAEMQDGMCSIGWVV